MQELMEAYYKTRFRFDPRREEVWKQVCRFIQKKHIPLTSWVVDLGAGYCSFINHIDAKEKHAVDLFQGFTEFANADVITHVSDCANLSFFEDEQFDVAFASNLLEHLDRNDSSQALSEIHRILKRGGKIILLQPNFRLCPNTYFDDYTHIQIFTDRSLCDLLEAFGFQITDCQARFLPVNMKSTLKLPVPGLPQLVRLYLRLPFRPLAGQMLIVGEKTKEVR